jgi:dTDP-4-dehydrorhamnose reductase
MTKKNSAVIIGANGQLGTDLRDAFSRWDVLALDGPPGSDIDITDPAGVRRVLFSTKGSLVINTAAFTNVPKCEELRDLAFQVNAAGAGNVAQACAETGSVLVHLSSDYVFDGGKRTPYTEDDTPNPLNYYGVSKLEGEKLVSRHAKQSYIIRTSGLYGRAGSLVKGENFVDMMLRLHREGRRLRVVDDEVLTPTSSRDLALQIRRIAEAMPPFGIYHATNDGECSWHEFAGEIFRLAGVRPDMEPVHQKDYGALVRRPLYSVLENRNLKKAGIDIMEDWHAALKTYMKEKQLLG